MTEPLMTLDEVAAYLGVPLRTLYDWRQRDKGPRAYRVGKHLRFKRADVEAWLEQCADPAPAA